MDFEIRMIDADELVPQEIPGYKDVGLVGFLEKVAFSDPLILKGPKGSGKTMGVEQWAATKGVPLLRYDCTDETSVRDFIGTFTLQGDEVFFALGVLTAGIENANKRGACVVVLEEINTLPPQAQKILNAIADYRQEVSIPKIGKVFRVNPNKKVWLVGTMNPNYGGTYNINEDMRSRFHFIEVEYMPAAHERALLQEQFDSPPSVDERRKVDNLMNIAKETRGSSTEYSLSTRDLVQTVKKYSELGSWDLALKMLEGKFEGDQVKNFRARVMSTFKVNLDTVKLF